MKEIKKPSFMREAAAQPGHSWIVEIFICLGIYMAGSFVMGIGQMPGIMAYLLQDRNYVHMMQTGEVDMELLMKLMQNLPEWLTIFILFTEILLIFIYMLYCRFVDHRKISTMGFSGEGAVGQYMRGLLMGIVMFVGAYFLCLVTASVEFQGIAENVIPAYILLYFCGYMIQGMAEEVICRGFLMVSLSRKYSVWFSAIVSSLFFMSLHFLNQGITWLSMLNLFLFGLFMALLFVESGNIWVVGAVHSVWNFLQGNIFGVQVSGLAKQNSVFETFFKEGRDLIHGGAFGMEGGLAVTVILVAAISLVYYRIKKRDMLLEEVSVNVEQEENPTVQGTVDSAEIPEDFRVYRSDPSVFTETPWRPEESRPQVQKSQETDSVHTVFNAEYFQIEEKE